MNVVAMMVFDHATNTKSLIFSASSESAYTRVQGDTSPLPEYRKVAYIQSVTAINADASGDVSLSRFQLLE